MSTPQTCVSESCKEHEIWKKGLRIHQDSNRINNPEATREIDNLTEKFANWKIDQINDSKEPTIRFDVEVQGRRVLAEIDCGATGNFVNLEWARDQNMLIVEEGTAEITLFDGRKKEVPKRNTVIPFKIGTTVHKQTFNALAETGRNKIVLGMPWLKEYNPSIDWRKKQVKIGKVQIRERPVCDPVSTERSREGTVDPQEPENRGEPTITVCQEGELRRMNSEFMKPENGEEPSIKVSQEDEPEVENPDYQDRLADAKERIPEVYHEFLEVFARRK